MNHHDDDDVDVDVLSLRLLLLLQPSRRDDRRHHHHDDVDYSYCDYFFDEENHSPEGRHPYLDVIDDDDALSK